MKIPSTYTFRLLATVCPKQNISYNFGAACDPEVLHKIHNADPAAPFMEISHREYVLCVFIFIYTVKS